MVLVDAAGLQTTLAYCCLAPGFSIQESLCSCSEFTLSICVTLAHVLISLSQQPPSDGITRRLKQDLLSRLLLWYPVLVFSMLAISGLVLFATRTWVESRKVCVCV